ncbi:MAG: SCP2 sterol-binding domain-containing protein [Pseudomonadota bacterium]
MSVADIFVSGVELAMNRCLAFDPATQPRLAQFSGKIIALELVGLGVTVYVEPTTEKVRVLARSERPADVTLAGTPIAFARMGLAKTPIDSLFAGEIKLSGDTELGQRFGEIIKGMDIDWEEMAAQVMGDVFAHKLGEGVRAGLRAGRKVAATLEQDTAEYLKEELREIPAREEVELFMQDVDTLRNDVERMAQRVARLRSRM